MLDLLIQNGHVVNAENSQDVDIAIKDGKIVAIGEAAQMAEAEKTIDAKGLWVLPGMIDAHAHLHKTQGSSPSLDDYYNGSIAAAYGGTTALIDFAFPYGEQTPQQAMEQKLNEIRSQSVIDYSFHSNLTRAEERCYQEIRELMQQGFPSVKMFTVNRKSGRMLEKKGVLATLRMIEEENGLAMIHAESSDLVECYIDDLVANGHTAAVDHQKAHPVISEVEAMYSVWSMLRETGAPALIAHLTSAAAGQMIRQAKKETKLFIETCPHYLALEKSVYDGADAALYVCSPPMRDEENRQGLWALLEEGLIDVINSDHTDFSSEQKFRNKDFFPKIPNGIPCLETRGMVLFSTGVATGRISENKFVEITSANQAKMMGLYPRKGVLQVGSDADIAIVDPKAKVRMTAKDTHMQTDFSVYEGMEMTGKVLYTIARGNVIIENGAFTNTAHRGELMRRTGPVL